MKVRLLFPDTFYLASNFHCRENQGAKLDLRVLKEYQKREEEFLNHTKDLENIINQRDAQKGKYDGPRKQRLDEFMAGFNLISLKLEEMYQVCFAELGFATTTDLTHLR